ncbi:SDR family NAD(P)-dependent oxidoreductase [Streptomyces endocoffeicus]|uniref:SDR family NAD(P)-dependent oxidoreductase n=1 Tax=Streptomyces endocoffeicus TaxID=2898945 RepID=UPI003557A866
MVSLTSRRRNCSLTRPARPPWLPARPLAPAPRSPARSPRPERLSRCPTSPSPREADTVLQSLAVDGIAVLADLADLAEVTALCGHVRDRPGPVDILVNNAGSYPASPGRAPTRPRGPTL